MAEKEFVRIAREVKRLARGEEADGRATPEETAAAKKIVELARAIAAMGEKPKTEKPPELSEVRAYLLGLSADGHTAEVRGLILKYGGERLSDIKPEFYASLLRDAEGLRHGGR